MLIKDEFRDAVENAKLDFKFDPKSVYVLPARGNGKSLMQAEIYNELFKGGYKVNFNNWINRGIDQMKAYNDKVAKEKKTEEVTNEPEKVEEEWIWVKGFKGTDSTMSCKGYLYELGKQFDMEEDAEIETCSSGFHFCKSLHNVFSYYDIGQGHRFFEVEALVRKSDWTKDGKNNSMTVGIYQGYGFGAYNNDKFAAKSIRFIRELTVDEVFDAYKSEDDAITTWTDNQKKRAMETTINKVKAEIRTEDLVAVGYSRPFAYYISQNPGRYTRALAVASQPELSMDVKVMTIFIDD